MWAQGYSQTAFQSEPTHVPTSSARESVTPHRLRHWMLSAFLILAILASVYGHLIRVFIYMSLIGNDVEHLLMGLLTSGHPMRKVPVQIIFLNHVVFSLLICRHSRYILATSPLPENILSWPVEHLFIPLMMSFDV